MCWICDHPGVHLPWSYPAGLTKSGLPEFVVTGMRIDRACCVLNCLAGDLVTRAEPYLPGSTHDVIVRDRCVAGELVTVTPPWAHLGFYGEDVRAMQFVHADEHGHWPWDTRYQGVPGGQPVLGTRAA